MKKDKKMQKHAFWLNWGGIDVDGPGFIENRPEQAGTAQNFVGVLSFCCLLQKEHFDHSG